MLSRCSVPAVIAQRIKYYQFILVKDLASIANAILTGVEVRTCGFARATLYPGYLLMVQGVFL
jgi:hypothetical protein